MKTGQRIYIGLVLLVLAGLGLASGFGRQQTYSENENRYLEQYPALSLSSVLSGEFQEDFEQALSDQFCGRDSWMTASTIVEKAAGYREISGVYLADDGYYFEKKTQDMISQKQYAKNLHYVEYLGTQFDGETSLLLVPSPATILSEKLPEGAPYYDADAMYQTAETVEDAVELIDVREALCAAKKKHQIYFRTDHHWTLRGAYEAYRVFCSKTGLSARSYSDFSPKKVTDDFYGTMYSKVLDVSAQPDTIYAAQNLPDVTLMSDGQQGQGVYDVQKLKQKDKYAYFFGGNYGTVTISASNDSTGKKLLIFKDSYANSMAPFLLGDYSEITMIDLRYYKESVAELLTQGYDQVMVLYEMSNFSEDTNLYKLVH